MNFVIFADTTEIKIPYWSTHLVSMICSRLVGEGQSDLIFIISLSISSANQSCLNLKWVANKIDR